MRGIGPLFVILEGMKVAVLLMGTVLPSLQLNNFWEGGLVDDNGLFKSPSL